jgi:fructose-specific phosphotransferase system IIC component
MLGVLGASSALAGLLLVFGGFLFAQASSFPSDTDDKITAKFEKVGRLSVWPFLAFLIVCVLCTVWLKELLTEITALLREEINRVSALPRRAP